jgi:hypothetical protein
MVDVELNVVADEDIEQMNMLIKKDQYQNRMVHDEYFSFHVEIYLPEENKFSKQKIFIRKVLLD